MEKFNYSFGELIQNESFRRWAQGNASRQEKSYWDKWVMKRPENRTLAIRAQHYIAGFSIRPSSRPDQDKVWNRIRNKMNADIGRNYTMGQSRRTRTQWIYQAAAVFLLVALTGLAIGLFTREKMDESPQKKQVVRNEVTTEYGERKTINLSDGSKIVLNAHSKLAYTSGPADSNAVEVFLDGEALFTIVKREKPTDTAFKVKTSAGLVKVMGTQFAVSTRNRNTEVALEEGKVSLIPLKRNEETILEPGQLATFHSGSDTIHTKFVNTEVYTSWSTYTLIFDKTPIRDVIARLENTYGVKVIVREPDLYKRKLSGSIDNTSLEVIVSALSRTLDTPAEITGGAVYIGEKYPRGAIPK